MVGRADSVAVNAKAIGQLMAAVVPWTPVRTPSKAGDVTDEWLTAHLARNVPGAVALSVTPRDGTTGTTDRRRLAVEWNEAGKAAGMPSQLFVKSTPVTAKNRAMVAALDMAVNEIRFYRRVAGELNGVAPRAWFARAGVGARFLLILENVVAQGGRPYALADRCEIEHARGLVDTFAGLHSRFWSSPRFTTDLR